MKYGIALLGNRVAPRCTHADYILMVSSRRNGVTTGKNLPMPNHSVHDLCDILLQHSIDALICGGITRENKEFLQNQKLKIIDNVISTVDDIILALKKNILCAGYGLGINSGSVNEKSSDIDQENTAVIDKNNWDCLACLDRACMRGKSCPNNISKIAAIELPDQELKHMLEASVDIACESERTLCRLSELIYFCLEMKYKRLGVAYCTDLQEPAEILVRLLRRFFDVFPVCCKVEGSRISNPPNFEGGKRTSEKGNDIACNPWGQAAILNHEKTDLNIMIGICMGADCIFMQASQAPVTTLFVKDKSLANNPIGALYSDYYLEEAAKVLTR